MYSAQRNCILEAKDKTEIIKKLFTEILGQRPAWSAPTISLAGPRQYWHEEPDFSVKSKIMNLETSVARSYSQLA